MNARGTTVPTYPFWYWKKWLCALIFMVAVISLVFKMGFHPWWLGGGVGVLIGMGMDVIWPSRKGWR